MAPSRTDDLVEIQQLLARYAVTITQGDVEAWSAVFTPDGTYSAFGETYALERFPVAGGRRPQGTVHDGHRTGRSGRRRHRHRTQPLCFIEHSDHDMRIGYYRDTYVRTGDGWRLRHAAMTFIRATVITTPASRMTDRPAAAAAAERLAPMSSTSSARRSTRWLDDARRRARRRHDGAGIRSTTTWPRCRTVQAAPSTRAGCGGAGRSASAASAARRCCGPSSARRSRHATSPTRPLLDDRGARADAHRLRPPELAAEMVPRLLSGDELWCQGFSEPGTGQRPRVPRLPRPSRRDDGWVVTGQKVWTSLAQYSDRCVLLTRTGAADRRTGASPRSSSTWTRPGSPCARSRSCTASTSSPRCSSTTSWSRPTGCSASETRAGRWP